MLVISYYIIIVSGAVYISHDPEISFILLKITMKNIEHHTNYKPFLFSSTSCHAECSSSSILHCLPSIHYQYLYLLDKLCCSLLTVR